MQSATGPLHMTSLMEQISLMKAQQDAQLEELRDAQRSDRQKAQAEHQAMKAENEKRHAQQEEQPVKYLPMD